MRPLQIAFVPTAGLSKDWLRVETIERLEITYAMYEQEAVTHIFLSAKNTNDEIAALAMMRDWLGRREVPPEAVTCDSETPSREDRAFRFVKFLEQLNYTPPAYIYVVTSWYHMPRCVWQIEGRLRQSEGRLPGLRDLRAVIARIKTYPPFSKCMLNMILEPFRFLCSYLRICGRQNRSS
jgi:hypothetical protein